MIGPRVAKSLAGVFRNLRIEIELHSVRPPRSVYLAGLNLELPRNIRAVADKSLSNSSGSAPRQAIHDPHNKNRPFEKRLETIDESAHRKPILCQNRPAGPFAATAFAPHAATLLRGSSVLGQNLAQLSEIPLLAALNESFGQGFQFLPASADGLGFLS